MPPLREPFAFYAARKEADEPGYLEQALSERPDVHCDAVIQGMEHARVAPRNVTEAFMATRALQKLVEDPSRSQLLGAWQRYVERAAKFGTVSIVDFEGVTE